MVSVTVIDVVPFETPNARTSAVVLHDAAGHRALPLWIGQSEALSIALGLRQAPTALRPLTIQFIKGILEAAEAQVEDVRIVALREGTFYALARIRSHAGAIRELDARPSDALALAVHTGRPMYVAEELMQAAGTPVPPGEQPTGRGLDALMQQFQSPGRDSAPLPDPVAFAFGMEQEAQQ